MTRKLTREEMQELISALRLTPTSTVNGISLGRLADALSENETAMDSEPVLYCVGGAYLDLNTISTCKDAVDSWVGEWNQERNLGEAEYETVTLYRHAQPAPERDNVRREHAEWSQATFGDVGPVGPLKHLSKEALEAAADPHDPLEWADMQFLLWDAQRRMGISDEFITRAMVEKLAINKARQWPEPKDGEPRLHIKEQPAPVVMDDTKLRELFDSWFASDCSFDLSPEASEADNIAWRESYWYVWQRCRTAMLNGGK